MDDNDSYKVRMEEIHHTEKKDAPSGTAITLAEGVLKEIERLERYKEGTGISEADLGIQSFRRENVPGTHTVEYSSEEDTIEIKHTAHSRRGFALGAIKVAEWIIHQKGILTMDDFLKIEN